MPTELTEMRRGDTPIWDLAVVNDDGSPFDLTGWTLYFTAKRQITDADADAVFQLTSGAGITITDAAGGLAAIQPRRADTDTITDEPRLIWDVQCSRDGSPDQTFTVCAWNDNPAQLHYLFIRRDVTRAP